MDTSVMAPSFFRFLTKSKAYREFVVNAASGAAGVSNISQAKLLAFEFCLPPLELQQTFATRVAAVERLKESHRRHLAELDALFASLQHRAFKGEL
jgi:type I restriction enzyme S subunit